MLGAILSVVVILTFPIFCQTSQCQSVPDSPNSESPPPPSPDNSNDSPPMLPAIPRVAVQGVVKNSLTGDPLPRALVQVNGETGPGALTDSNGRFEVMVPGQGPQVFQLTKPGFHDLPVNASGSTTLLENFNPITHSVNVSEGMPALSFAMMPTGVIRGHIDLSTGDPGQGIGVLLLRRTVQSGHAMWRAAANTRTNSDGAYRFAALDVGEYAIATESARDTDVVSNLVEPSSDRKIAWNGYAATYYPDTREFSTASKIHLHAGETAQANLTLRLEPFHLVRATVAPLSVGDKSVVDYAASLADSQGHPLSYPAQYDSETRTVQAMLPDGTYTLQVTAVSRSRLANGLANIDAFSRNAVGPNAVLQGTTAFAVAGRPITSLRIALAQRESSPLAVSVVHNSAQPSSSSGDKAAVSISASQAGDTLVDGMWTQFAQGAIPGSLESSVLAPGSYLVHTSIAQHGLCESSFTAGGASLAREPLTVGAGGAIAAMALTLRDDCATLKLSLPPTLMSQNAGEEAAFTVYVVPDFDSTVDVTPLTLRPSSGGSITLDNLTPGKYHVYAFAMPVELEYRNPDATAALPNPGQAVTLDPSSTSTLVLEAPAP